MSRLYPFPLVYSVLPVGKNSLVEMLGIKDPEVFAPADVEADPQLEIIAEWRDYSQIENSRIHDVILTKMFQWMETGGYKLKTTDLAKDISAFGEMTVKSTGKMPEATPPGFVTGTVDSKMARGVFVLRPRRCAFPYIHAAQTGT